MPQPPDDQYVTIEEAARILGMPRRTIMRWVRQEHLAAVQTDEGEIRVRRDDVVRLSVCSPEELPPDTDG